MSYLKICCFLLVSIFLLLQKCDGLPRPEINNDLLNWYYSQYKKVNIDRFKRQRNYDYNNNEDDDEWYVFDRVDEDDNVSNQRNSINGQFWQNAPPRPPQTQPPVFFPTFPTTTRPLPFPRAEARRINACLDNCNARTTPEYNPVCGTDNVTYMNNGRFECARYCGKSIGMKMMGRCAPILPPT